MGEYYFPSEDFFEELFEELELPQMEMPEANERRTRGKPRYPDEPMLNALMLIPFGVASENELARKLAEIPTLSEDCGFEEKRTPSQPTINRFKHRLGVGPQKDRQKAG